MQDHSPIYITPAIPSYLQSCFSILNSGSNISFVWLFMWLVKILKHALSASELKTNLENNVFKYVYQFIRRLNRGGELACNFLPSLFLFLNFDVKLSFATLL